MVRTTNITFDGTSVPVKVKMEWRKTVRYSIAKKSINLLIPKFYTKIQIIGELEKLKNWCGLQFQNDPSLLERFKSVAYQHRGIFNIYEQDFRLDISRENRKTCTAHVGKNKEVYIKCPDDIDRDTQNRLIGMVLSRVFANYFQKDIEHRVIYYNQKYFQEDIESIRIKNNQSNWGSCSTKRNINLSSRLLFAPKDVLDYVIIHELAHLKEMNHSSRFWKIVETVMPNYQEKEDWLSDFGNTLKF